MDAEIEVAEALWKHARILGKSRDPEIRIAAAKAEIRLKADLDKLRAERPIQPALSLAHNPA